MYKVLNKISPSDEPNTSPTLATSSPPTLTESALVGLPEAKRSYYTDQEPEVCFEWESRKVSPDAVWQEHPGNQLPSSQKEQCEENSEMCLPQRKRKFTAASLVHGDACHSLEAWSQDPLFSYSQCTESEFELSCEQSKRTTSPSALEPSLSDSLPSETTFGLHVTVTEATSTQNSLTPVSSSVMDGEKENGGCTRTLSPKKHSVRTRSKPLKHGVQEQNEADRKRNIDLRFDWTKPRTSPLKKPKLYHKTVDDDSLAMLFTQDSEGLRVIAHRGLPERSPLKDQSNTSHRNVRSGSSKPLVEDEDDEMLFTQDSQGNLVIKH